MVIPKNAQISNKNKTVLENKCLTEEPALLQRILVYRRILPQPIFLRNPILKNRFIQTVFRMLHYTAFLIKLITNYMCCVAFVIICKQQSNKNRVTL